MLAPRSCPDYPATRIPLRQPAIFRGNSYESGQANPDQVEAVRASLAFDVNLLTVLDQDPEPFWACLQHLTKEAVLENALEGFWGQKKALAPSSLIRVLFHESVLNVIRRELNRHADARLEMQDVFNAIRDVLSKEALLEAGDISVTKRRKKRRKVKKIDAITGQTTEVEEETDEDDEEPTKSAVPPVIKDVAATPPPAAPPAASV
jgi:hypothetical protein